MNHLDEPAYAVRHQLYSANIQQIVIYFEFLIVMNFTLKWLFTENWHTLNLIFEQNAVEQT